MALSRDRFENKNELLKEFVPVRKVIDRFVSGEGDLDDFVELFIIEMKIGRGSEEDLPLFTMEAAYAESIGVDSKLGYRIPRDQEQRLGYLSYLVVKISEKLVTYKSETYFLEEQGYEKDDLFEALPLYLFSSYLLLQYDSLTLGGNNTEVRDLHQAFRDQFELVEPNIDSGIFFA